MGIGTLEVHPIDLLGAYGVVANGGVLMPRQMILSVMDPNGRIVWPLKGDKPEGQAGHEPAGRLHHHRHHGRQHRHEDQPVLGQVRDLRQGPSPTGRLQDGHDERQPRRRRLRLPRPAQGQGRTGARGRRLDGQQRQLPQRRQALARHVGAAVVGDPDRRQQGPADREVQVARRPQDGDGRRIHRDQARPVHAQDRRGVVHPGHLPPKSTRQPGDAPDRRRERPALADGCVGPKVTRGFFDISEVDSNFPSWQQANRNWASRAARGSGVRGTSKGTRTAYFYNGQFRPFGRSWGAPFAPSRKCPLAPPPEPPVCDPLLGTPLSEPAARGRRGRAAAAGAADRSATARRSSPRRRPRRARPGAPSCTSG